MYSIPGTYTPVDLGIPCIPCVYPTLHKPVQYTHNNGCLCSSALQIPPRDDVPVLLGCIGNTLSDVDPALVHWLVHQLLCYQYQSVHLVSPNNQTGVPQ